MIRDYFTAWTGGADIVARERRLARAVEGNDYQEERNLSSFLAKASYAAGDPDRSLQLMGRFLDQTHDADAFEFPMIGRYALHAGKLDAAKRALHEAEKRSAGALSVGVEALRAGIAAVEGRRDDALGLYRASLSGYRSYGMKFALALTVLDMAKLLGGDDPAVKSVVPEARGILEELGATPLISQLDELAGPVAKASAPERAGDGVEAPTGGRR